MKSYAINSIDINYCKYNDPDLLEALERCIKCHKIPLPTYKSSQNLLLSYCQNCYEEEKLDPQNLIEPTKGMDFLLKKLVINCKYDEKGCNEKYQFNSLQNLVDHQKICFFNNSRKTILKENTININETIENCLRCFDLNVDVTNHDCLTTLVKLILDMANKFRSFTLMYEQQKTEKEETFLQLQNQIADLSQKLHSSMEKQISDLNHIRTNNAKTKHEIQSNLNQTLRKQHLLINKTQDQIISLDKDINQTLTNQHLLIKNSEDKIISLEKNINQTQTNQQILINKTQHKINSSLLSNISSLQKHFKHQIKISLEKQQKIFNSSNLILNNQIHNIQTQIKCIEEPVLLISQS